MKRKFITTIKIGNELPFKFKYEGNTREEVYEDISDFFFKLNIYKIAIKVGKEVK